MDPGPVTCMCAWGGAEAKSCDTTQPPGSRGCMRQFPTEGIATQDRYGGVEQQYKIRLLYQERGHMREDEGMRRMSGKSHFGHFSPISEDTT